MRTLLSILLIVFSSLSQADGTATVGKVTVIEDMGSNDTFVREDSLHDGFKSVVDGMNRELERKGPVVIRITRSQTQLKVPYSRLRAVVDIELEIQEEKFLYPAFPVFEAGGASWEWNTFRPLLFMLLDVLKGNDANDRELDLTVDRMNPLEIRSRGERWLAQEMQRLVAERRSGRCEASVARLYRTRQAQLVHLLVGR